MASFVKSPARFTRPYAIRTYATRRPERPPPKIKDPLLAPNATHYKVTENVTFIHRPPPSAPTPFSLSTAPASPLLSPLKPTIPLDLPQSVSTSPLPPPVWKPKGSKKVLDKRQIEVIKSIRAENPTKWTQGRIAKRFGCTRDFVGLIAPLNTTQQRIALEARDNAHEAKRRGWGERKATYVAIRQKRKSLW